MEFFEDILKSLHPFMPFITEELWHFLNERKDGESIMTTSWPAAVPYDHKLLESFTYASEVITAIRGIRKDKNMGMKEQMVLMIKKNNNESPDLRFDDVAKKLCNLSAINYVDEKPENAFTFISGSTEFYMPVTESVDIEAEMAKLQQELEYNRGFLNSVMKKLSNENFVRNAKEEVVDIERKKQADAASKIRVLEEQIKALKK
jgi:valyl-tRNA synthetase